MRGLDPQIKHHPVANYLLILRAELLLALARSCGVAHPALVTPDHIEIVGERYRATRVAEVFDYAADWPVLSSARHAEIESLQPRPDPAPIGTPSQS